MKKYLANIRIGILDTLTYRGPMFIWIVGNMLSTGVMAAIWLSAGGGQLISGYTREQLVSYYVVGLFLQWLVNWLPFYNVSDDIKSGDIALKYLLKPISFFWTQLTGDVGWHIVSIVIGAIGTMVLAMFFGGVVNLEINLSQAALLLISIILAIFIVFTTSLCLGLIAFWLTEVSVFETLFWSGRMFLGGQGIPISFFPSQLQLLIKILPFRYMFSFPLEIAFQRVNQTEIVIGFLMQVVWVAVLLFIYRILWAKGRLAYSAFGR